MLGLLTVSFLSVGIHADQPKLSPETYAPEGWAFVQVECLETTGKFTLLTSKVKVTEVLVGTDSLLKQELGFRYFTPRTRNAFGFYYNLEEIKPKTRFYCWLAKYNERWGIINSDSQLSLLHPCADMFTTLPSYYANQFPDWKRPTPEEAENLARAMAKVALERDIPKRVELLKTFTKSETKPIAEWARYVLTGSHKE